MTYEYGQALKPNRPPNRVFSQSMTILLSNPLNQATTITKIHQDVVVGLIINLY